MAKYSSLLEEEEIICRGPEDLILTSDGWIGQLSPHGYEGITEIFRMLHVRDITSIYLSKKTTLQKAFHLLLVSNLILATITFFLLPISYGSDIFLNGFDIDTCQNVGTENWSCEGEENLFADILEMLFPSWNAFYWGVIIIPITLGILATETSERLDPRLVLIIQHKNGIMSPQAEMSSGLWWLWGASIFWWLVLHPSPGSGMSAHLDVFFALILLILGFLILKFVKSEFSLGIESNPNYSEIKQVDLHTFHSELLAALELPNQTGTTQQLVSIGERLESELAEIRKRLDDQDAILTTIIPVYADIFASPTPWLGTAAIRLSTEMLLKHRHSQLLPGASKKHKTLRNYTDELRKHDKDLDSETLGSIETIISLGNQAAHGRGSSKEDYISALQKFVEVVEWHLSKPTI